jgi:hypothetical protein
MRVFKGVNQLIISVKSGRGETVGPDENAGREGIPGQRVPQAQFWEPLQ